MTDVLSIWTVYNSPRDYPDRYVARRFEIVPGTSEPQVTDDVITAFSLATVRSSLMLRGLTVLPREAGDQPHIVESWV